MTPKPSLCARCAGPAGAHQPWCVIGSLVERFLAPPAPTLDIAAVTEMVRAAAREAAREAVTELLQGMERRPDLRAVPEPPDEPEPVAPAARSLEAQLGETVAQRARQAHGGQREHERAEKAAAADLFVSEKVTAGGKGAFVSSPELMAAYEAWRPTIEAPALTPRDLGMAMTRAGHTNRRQARAGDPGFGYGTPLPNLYFGIALKAAEPAAPAEPEVLPEWMTSASADKRKVSDADRIPYDGPYPGREVPAEFRNKIIMPILKSGKGWTYAKGNANGAGKPRLISPDGRVYSLPNTPSDWRGLRNTMATFRKAGAL